MNKKILLEDTPPRGDWGSQVPLAVFIAAAVWAVGATVLHLALGAL